MSTSVYTCYLNEKLRAQFSGQQQKTTEQLYSVRDELILLQMTLDEAIKQWVTAKEAFEVVEGTPSHKTGMQLLASATENIQQKLTLVASMKERAANVELKLSNARAQMSTGYLVQAVFALIMRILQPDERKFLEFQMELQKLVSDPDEDEAKILVLEEEVLEMGRLMTADEQVEQATVESA